MKTHAGIDMNGLEQELIQNALLKLAQERTDGKLSFLSGHEDARDVVLIVSENRNPAEEQEIDYICYERLGVLRCAQIKAVDALCLDGPPEKLGEITADMSRRILQLVDLAANENKYFGRGIVLPQIWAIVYKDKPAHLQIGLRVPDTAQPDIADQLHQLAQDLKRDFDLLVHGEAITIGLSNTPATIAERMPKPAAVVFLPDIMADMATKLEARAAVIRGWQPGEPLPDGIKVSIRAEDGIPAMSILSDRGDLKIICPLNPKPADEDEQNDDTE